MIKIKKVKVGNYRLLKEFTLDLEKDLSLVIGKNNTGKTSFLSVLEKFLGSKAINPEFSCDDFNLEFQKYFKSLVEAPPKDIPFLGIYLKLFIEYEDKDDLSNLRKVIMDLDPKNKTVVLAFEYMIPQISFNQFVKDYNDYSIEREKNLKEKKVDKKEIEEKKKAFFYEFLKDKSREYFRPRRKTVWFDMAQGKEEDTQFIDLDKEGIPLDKIINFKMIGARRDVSNKDSNKALSILSSRYYEKKEALRKDSDAIKAFKQTLTETDEHLTQVYEDLFDNVVKKVEQFGGVKIGDSNISIVSTLQHRDLLKGNTTVMYDHNDEHSLPEHYNGLGYMNLIGIIFEIEVLLTDFRKEAKESEVPSDINLLFVEEPEAHTHPQMQYVFIKNVKNILKAASQGDSGKSVPFNLQSIISTHSSHIAAQSQFNDIKYFLRSDKNQVTAKNLQDLEKEYDDAGEKENFRFLKQYLTLNRAELFFADKAIFIEGDTERILLPAMMRKIDQDEPDNPLLSQNISIVEVGAYSQIFEKFINFIGIKSLVVTDIDSGLADRSACEVDNAKAVCTTNSALKFYFGGKDDLAFFKKLKIEEKCLKRNGKKWEQKADGHLLIIFQTSEKNQAGKTYYARSFEDSFFHLNSKLITDNKTEFKSLKNIGYFDDPANGPYILANSCITKKPSFAMEILLSSKVAAGKEFSNWEITGYIKEGLSWLKKD